MCAGRGGMFGARVEHFPRRGLSGSFFRGRERRALFCPDVFEVIVVVVAAVAVAVVAAAAMVAAATAASATSVKEADEIPVQSMGTDGRARGNPALASVASSFRLLLPWIGREGCFLARLRLPLIG